MVDFEEQDGEYVLEMLPFHTLDAKFRLDSQGLWQFSDAQRDWWRGTFWEAQQLRAYHQRMIDEAGGRSRIIVNDMD